MKIRVYRLSSFTDSINGGNPAGVVLNADNLKEGEMKYIAKEVGYSETAFVSKSDKADFKVRFFTPVDEVDLCGHATIATFSLLNKKGIISPGKYNQETKAGLLGIDVSINEEIMMDQNIPYFGEYLDKKIIAEALNISVEDFYSEYPVQIVSTGLKDIIVPIKSFDKMNFLIPNFDKIAKICVENDSAGFHIFNLERKNFHASCRNFAPNLGIKEESATGTASGALASYFVEQGIYKPNKKMVFEQGYKMKKPSKIKAIVESKEGIYEKVKVGGKAVIIDEITIEL
ncbi:PhzF family phenazine biosynthesis protein [Geotoga petraea]|uniref:Phenazine biosynthesis protein PhzF family n=1 Tax=Geotoga petraea TaxID=28234 RepID=A0A1G6KZW1_9BACT|nr:PhzF family phenazine biosynthesis protein [Geotoga petraea]SDC35896.1 phenazine biosynthesis protein PhzF family [Geotoga petraea]